MKECYYKKSIKNKTINIKWRGTTEGETLYRRLFKGVKKMLLAPFLILYRDLTCIKLGEELPSGSHCPKVYYNTILVYPVYTSLFLILI